MTSERLPPTGNESEIDLSVIVPVYNELECLEESLIRVLFALPEVRKEVLIVDDGSTDGTREWLKSKFQIGEKNEVIVSEKGEIESLSESSSADRQDAVPLRVIFMPHNRGKGAALRQGFELAAGSVFVIHDADLEYDPRDWRRMWPLFDEDLGDIVYGSRFYGEPHRSLFFLQYLANRLVSFLVSLTNNAKLTDIETCYKMFRREVLEDFALEADDFGFEVEFTSKALCQRKWRFYEVGISYHGRSYEEGKKIGWKDGLKALGYLVRFRFFP